MREHIVLEAINIGKKYGLRPLFSGITFSVGSGDCLGITGSNGSGKTTLLKILAGLIRPGSGAVRVAAGGTLLDAEKKMACFGMVSPEMIMYNSLTGWENIVLLAGARGSYVSETEAAGFCDQVGLGVKGKELVKTYSTGMKQRLKFALLQAVDPPVWLLDEPSSNLDREGRKLVADLIAGALQRKTAIILATNDEAEVAYAHKTVALS
jgi:heme exporter protein A